MGMRHAEEPVALQAIEFWATVCEEEIELAIEAEEVGSCSDLKLKPGDIVWRGTSCGIETLRQDGINRDPPRTSRTSVSTRRG